MKFLSSCSSHFLQLFTSKVPERFHKPGAISFKADALDSPKPIVGMKLKDQLFRLVHQLEDSRPHFVLCINPNIEQLPGVYEAEHVLQQLRCSRVSEVVKLSRSGYPTRMTHQEFVGRYGFLLSKVTFIKDPLSLSIAVLQRCSFLPGMYQIGYRKVYLRSGQAS